MPLIGPTTPYGYVIFCDDIREEKGAKNSYMGMYNGTLFVPAFPVVIPRLALGVHYNERPGESDEPVKLKIIMSWDEGNPLEVDLPIEQMRSQPRPDYVDASDDPLVGFLANFQIANLIVPTAGRIRVRAFRGENEYRLGSLHIVPQPEEQTRTPADPA